MRALCCPFRAGPGDSATESCLARQGARLSTSKTQAWSTGHVQKDSLSLSRGRRGWERERSSEEGLRAAPGSSEFSDGDVDTQPRVVSLVCRTQQVTIACVIQPPMQHTGCSHASGPALLRSLPQRAQRAQCPVCGGACWPAKPPPRTRNTPFLLPLF